MNSFKLTLSVDLNLDAETMSEVVNRDPEKYDAFVDKTTEVFLRTAFTQSEDGFDVLLGPHVLQAMVKDASNPEETYMAIYHYHSFEVFSKHFTTTFYSVMAGAAGEILGEEAELTKALKSKAGILMLGVAISELIEE